MKYLIFLLFFVPNLAFGQQYSQFGLFAFNPFAYNPAAAATKNYTDVKLAYRQQWAGFEGSPQTFWASVSGFYRQKRQSKRYLPERYHGFGAWLYADRIGITEQNSAAFSYSYHLTLQRHKGEEIRASVGFSLAYHQFSFNTNRIIVSNPVDNFLPNGQTQGTFDGNLGFWLYSKYFFVGLSANNFAQSRIGFGNSKLASEYFLMGGYKIDFVENELSLIPSFLLKMTNLGIYQIDLNAALRYSDIFWTGIVLRYPESVGGGIGFNVAQIFDLNYAYETPVGGFFGTNSGSHEIVMSFKLGNYKYRHRIRKPETPLYD